MNLGPLPKQHPDYHPGHRLPWWSRPSGAIGHVAWFRAMAEVEARSPDRGGHPAPTVWRVYADAVSPPTTGRLLATVVLDPDASEAERSAAILGVLRAHGCDVDAGRFNRTQDPA